jgi:acyl-CoA oxidase
VKEVAPIIADYWERAEFPHTLIPKCAPLKLGGGTLAGYGCPGLTVTEFAMAIVEMARVDASFSTFLMVHNCLAMLTIGLLGSEEQKAKWLPRMASLDCVGCWGLTEPSNGSDASALTTKAEWVGGKWRITGQKRWIGNGTFAECVVVWARNTTSNQVLFMPPASPARSRHVLANPC